MPRFRRYSASHFLPFQAQALSAGTLLALSSLPCNSIRLSWIHAPGRTPTINFRLFLQWVARILLVITRLLLNCIFLLCADATEEVQMAKGSTPCVCSWGRLI